MNNKFFNWFIFIALSFVWGSSFILIKEGLKELTAYQVASLRIIASGLVLFPIAIRHIRSIPVKKLPIVFLSGVMGSLIPAYLFCIAEAGKDGIDSGLAGTLNALTPVFVIIAGALLFKIKPSSNKILGIFVSFVGSILLYLAQPNYAQIGNAINVLLVVLATMLYGINVNTVGKYLKDIPSIQIAAVGLTFISFPALVILYFTGYFSQDFLTRPMLISTGYTALLGIFGTALASIFFYMLLKRAGAVFASMVTYAIPAVALMWGIVYGEQIGWKQFVCLLIILSGVYIANRNVKKATS